MLLILSPSKTLGKLPIEFRENVTLPLFIGKAALIMAELRKYDTNAIEKLMGVSTTIAQLNFERFIQWQLPFTIGNSSPAIATFKGDVYEGLGAQDFNEDELLFAQMHLRILTGLYGVLRPLDLMQPYRLEMATNIRVGKYDNLYDFWRNDITSGLNRALSEGNSKILLNLASKEYFAAINVKKIEAKIVTPEFRQYNNGNPKVVPILAKRARGLMSRFVIQNRITDVELLKQFDAEGYVFNDELSTDRKFIFVRYA
jgi:uncharacterized protein